MSDEMPEGWVDASLGEVSRAIQYGYTASSKALGYGPRFLRITDIQDGRVNWNAVPTCDISSADLDKFRLQCGDIVFARSGATTGKSFLLRECPENSVFASYLIRVRAVVEAIDPQYLCYFFNTPQYWSFISDNLAGNAQPNCNASKLSALPVPVAPLAEQRRIVAKVEALLAEVNAARERLAKVPAILKRFRQSVLAAACSGRLTEEWREARTANNLRAECPEERLAPRSGRSRRPGRLWGGGEVPELTADERDSIPPTWRWLKVAELGADPAETVQIGPMSMKSSEFTDAGIPVLNVGCVQSGWIDDRKCNYLPPSEAADFGRYQVTAGDVLFTRSGTVGRCAVVTAKNHGNVITFHLLRVRPAPARCLPEYLRSVFEGVPSIRRQTSEGQIGSTRAGFNTRLLASLDVPVPPGDEQHEIVRRVEMLFKAADTIEKHVAAATARADKITQAVLAKAFRGELVPTEAELAREEGREYEPASVLLERIAKERATSGPKESKKRPKRDAA